MNTPYDEDIRLHEGLYRLAFGPDNRERIHNILTVLYSKREQYIVARTGMVSVMTALENNISEQQLAKLCDQES